MTTRKTHHYKGEEFEVTRTSGGSVTVELECDAHEHQEFIIGLMEEGTVGWVVGRKEAGYPFDGDFVQAIERAADLLIEECQTMDQLDVFFAHE